MILRAKLNASKTAISITLFTILSYQFISIQLNDVMVTPRDGGGDEDKISLITAASTTPQESIESSQTGTVDADGLRKSKATPYQQPGGAGRTYSYKKRRPSSPSSIFSAPPGVNPHHVSSSTSRRNTGGSRLVFIWPQKSSTRGRLLRVMAPLMHAVVMGLLFLDAVHLWPGELLPDSLPSSSPPPQPPIKCNIIEPLWFDNT